METPTAHNGAPTPVNHLVNRKPLTPIQLPLRNVDKPGNNSRKFNG